VGVEIKLIMLKAPYILQRQTGNVRHFDPNITVHLLCYKKFWMISITLTMRILKVGLRIN